MDSPFLLMFVGLVYIVALGGLSLIRREGLSIRFAVESLTLVAFFGLLGFLTGFVLHPVLFILLLYLVTMRVRLVVDLGTNFAQRRRFTTAERLYQLAQSFGPDSSASVAIALNQGVMNLQRGNLEEAVRIFQEVLARPRSNLGLKHEVACHYNLGVARERQGATAEAMQEYKIVVDLWPVSEYSRRASAALSRQAGKDADIRP